MVTEFDVWSINLDKNRPSTTRDYLRWAVGQARPGPAVLGLQERGRGLTSTRVRGVRLKVRRKRHRVLGNIGAHRAVAVGRVRIDGRVVRVLSVHGLHPGTVGHAANKTHLRRLARWAKRMTRKGRLWIIAGDFNRHYATVAALVGAHAAYGHRIDGVLVSPGLEITHGLTSDYGELRGWTDHPAIRASIRLQPNPT